MATDTRDAINHFVLSTVDLDKVSVGRTDEGHVTVARPLRDDAVTTMEDVHDLATEHGLGAIDARADPDAGTLTVVFDGGEA